MAMMRLLHITIIITMYYIINKCNKSDDCLSSIIARSSWLHACDSSVINL
jgi:hypothetical protein